MRVVCHMASSGIAQQHAVHRTYMAMAWRVGRRGWIMNKIVAMVSSGMVRIAHISYGNHVSTEGTEAMVSTKQACSSLERREWHIEGIREQGTVRGGISPTTCILSFRVGGAREYWQHEWVDTFYA